MAKQSLFYEEVVPLTKERHMGWSVQHQHTYAFAAKQHSVPPTHTWVVESRPDARVVGTLCSCSSSADSAARRWTCRPTRVW